MARSVTFNGITRFRPGGIVKINASALNQIGITANNVVGLVGEADGGTPGASAASLISLRDPSQAVELFRSGPLVDAIRLAFQSSGDSIIAGGAAQVYVYKTNASTQSAVHIPSESISLVSDTAAAGSTTTAVNLTVGGLTASQYKDRWVDIEILALPVGSRIHRRRISDNAAGALTLSSALPQAPAAADPVVIRATYAKVTSSDYGSHTNDITVDVDYAAGSYQVSVAFDGSTQVSDNLGGDNHLQVVYTGGAPTVAADTVAALSTVSLVNLTTGGLGVGAHNGKTVKIGDEYRKITTNTATVLNLTTPLSAVPDVGTVVQILDVTDAVASVTGSLGKATGLSSTITGVAGDNLSLSFAAGLTVSQLVAAINENGNYTASIPAGINGSLPAVDLDFGTGTQINIQESPPGITAGFKKDVAAIVGWMNASAAEVNASRFDGEGQDGCQAPAAVTPGVALQLYGGSRGVSANSDFQAGLDALLLKEVNYVVPLIDRDLSAEGLSSTATWASVSQQLLDHVVRARGAAGLERGGFIGFRGTKTQIVAAANGLNDEDVQLMCQNPTVLGASGSLAAKGPRMLAVMGASMRAGVPEIGEPLTNKYLRVSALSQDSSWDPSDVTDSADLINAGVTFAETIPGQGTRWVRDITTYVKTDNLAYMEGSVRDVVRYIAFNLRKELDNRFTGRKSAPSTVSAVRDAAASLLEAYRSDDIIVDSTDPATGEVIRAYHNLKVTSSGDVISVNVGIFPVPGINFELIEIFLQLPTQSA